MVTWYASKAPRASGHQVGQAHCFSGSPCPEGSWKILVEEDRSAEQTKAFLNQRISENDGRQKSFKSSDPGTTIWPQPTIFQKFKSGNNNPATAHNISLLSSRSRRFLNRPTLERASYLFGQDPYHHTRDWGNKIWTSECNDRPVKCTYFAYSREMFLLKTYLWTVFCMYSFCSLCQQWPGPSVLWLGIHNLTSSSSPLVARIGREGCGSRTFTTPLSSPGISFTIPSVWRRAKVNTWVPSADSSPACPTGRCCHNLSHWSQTDCQGHRSWLPSLWRCSGDPGNMRVNNKPWQHEGV